MLTPPHATIAAIVVQEVAAPLVGSSVATNLAHGVAAPQVAGGWRSATSGRWPAAQSSHRGGGTILTPGGIATGRGMILA